VAGGFGQWPRFPNGRYWGTMRAAAALPGPGNWQTRRVEHTSMSLSMYQASVPTFTGQPYLLQFVMPNFYFHATAAYAILRHNGVELGTRDFMGQVPGLNV
jgi:hypothetical protein